MAICTFNARTLASEACIEDLMMQARKIKYDVIGLTETRRHRPLGPGTSPLTRRRTRRTRRLSQDCDGRLERAICEVGSPLII